MSADANQQPTKRFRFPWWGSIVDFVAGALLLGLGIWASAGFALGLITGAFGKGIEGLTFLETVVVAVAILSLLIALGAYCFRVGVREWPPKSRSSAPDRQE